MRVRYARPSFEKKSPHGNQGLGFRVDMLKVCLFVILDHHIKGTQHGNQGFRLVHHHHPKICSHNVSKEAHFVH